MIPTVFENLNLEFWNVSRTCEELDITATSLKKVRPYLHVLRLPRNTSLYPSIYTGLFKDTISGIETRQLAVPARELARTALALDTIHLEEDTLDFALHEATYEGHIYTRDLREMLDISPATFTDWQKRGDLPMIKRGRFLTIPRGPLEAAISWQRPEGMSPAGPLVSEPLSPMD